MAREMATGAAKQRIAGGLCAHLIYINSFSYKNVIMNAGEAGDSRPCCDSCGAGLAPAPFMGLPRTPHINEHGMDAFNGMP